MNPSPAIPPPSSSNASVPMVVITVVGIFAAFALLASYYAFVTKCQLVRGVLSRSRSPPWRGGHGARGREPSVIRAVATEDRGLGLPLIRMLPVVKFTAAAAADPEDAVGMAGRISVSECAVCLSEFVERERVRLLPNCSHAFHIDCIDTWLQGSARCPFCRSDVTLPPALVHAPAVRPTSTTAPSYRASCGDDDVGVERRRHRDELFTTNDSVVIELRGEHKSWVSQGQPAGRRLRKQQQRKVVESVGDEAIDTRKKDLEFSVQPIRRSLSMDSSCDKQHYMSVVQEFLTQRQV